MAADTLSSASIVALDVMNPGNAGGPIAILTSGEGSQADVRDLSDFVTPTALGLANTGSKYKILRVSPEIKIKALTLVADGVLDSSTGLALDVGAYYSDSTVDGTPAALQGTAISVNCFLAIGAAFQSSSTADVNALTAFSLPNRNKRLWEALGLSANPGGNIDIVVAVHTAATTAASHNLGLRLAFAK